MDHLGSRRYSAIWKHFKVKDNFVATCKACNNDYSFRTTVGNLSKHWKKKHANEGDSSDDSDESSFHRKKISVKSELEPKSTWQYFDILDSDKFVAKCKLCDKDISYDSISELTEHVKEHDVIVSDDDDIDLTCEEQKLNVTKSRKQSPLWRFMQDVGDKCAICQICMKKLSYSAGTSNLMKHLKRKHPDVKLHDGDDQKLIISANGQIYEVETSDAEKDPIMTNEVYLESDFATDNYETIKSSSPLKQKYKKIKQNEQRRKKRYLPEIYHSQYRSNSSDEDVSPVKKNNKKDTIDYFGPYIISMLKELPKKVSDQLQSEIIKQIVAAKVALEEQHTNVFDKPVTVSVNKGTANSIPEITVNCVTDVEMTETKFNAVSQKNE